MIVGRSRAWWSLHVALLTLAAVTDARKSSVSPSPPRPPSAPPPISPPPLPGYEWNSLVVDKTDKPWFYAVWSGTRRTKGKGRKLDKMQQSQYNISEGESRERCEEGSDLVTSQAECRHVASIFHLPYDGARADPALPPRCLVRFYRASRFVHFNTAPVRSDAWGKPIWESQHAHPAGEAQRHWIKAAPVCRFNPRAMARIEREMEFQEQREQVRGWLATAMELAMGTLLVGVPLLLAYRVVGGDLPGWLRRQAAARAEARRIANTPGLAQLMRNKEIGANIYYGKFSEPEFAERRTESSGGKNFFREM